MQKSCQKLHKVALERMSKDALRCDSLQFSLHNLQISLLLCSHQDFEPDKKNGGFFA